MTEIRPQKGPQEAFLSTSADVAIYGGAAGGGKTYALEIEPLRHVSQGAFNGMIFRRVGAHITTPGGLWDTALSLYTHIDGEPIESKLTFKFDSGSKIKFAHLEHDKNRFDHQGGQYPFIGFDELTHFTEKQFWYLFSRNRPPPGCTVKPYIRATTNPVHRDDPTGGWVRELIDWWIDSEGYPIPERSGVLRYFVRNDDTIKWVDKDYRDPSGLPPKSLTFIPAKLSDNKILMDQDPTYEATLNSMGRVDRMRLLGGNWDVSDKGGMFERTWFKIIENEPDTEYIRYWDRAATEPTPKNPNPDWTAGAKVGMYKGGLCIADINHFQGNSATNETNISHTAEQDGFHISIGIELEPGSSGKDAGFHYQTKVLKGYHVILDRPTGDKVERCKPWCALAEHGNVYIVRGAWNDAFIKEAISFPFGKKDQIDAVSGGYKQLTQQTQPEWVKARI